MAHAAFARVAAFVDSYEHRALTLLVVLLALDFADRSMIGALGPTLEHVFHIGNAQLGLLTTIIVGVSILFTLPFGILTDRVKRTWVISGTLLIWAVAEGLTGAAISYAMLVIVRIFLGMISAAYGPITPSMVGDLVPADERGRAFGSIDSGTLIGEGVGYALPAILLGFLVWRWNFWVLAVCGLILAVIFFFLPEPERAGAQGPQEEGVPAEGQGRRAREARQMAHSRIPRGSHGPSLTRVQQIVQRKGIQPARRSMVRQEAEDTSLWYAVKYTVRVRTDLIVLLARSAGDFFFMGIGVFAVVFATQWYRLGQREAEVLFLMIGIGAFLGIIIAGRVSDYLLDREHVNSRIVIGAISFIIAPIALFFGILTHNLWIAVPLFFVGAFFLGAAEAPLDAVRIDVLVARLRGRAESVRQIVRAIAEGGAPIIIGWLSGYLAGGGAKGLQEAFLVTLPLVLAAGIILLFAIPTYGPDVAAALASARKQEEIDEREAEQESSARDEGEQQPTAGRTI